VGDGASLAVFWMGESLAPAQNRVPDPYIEYFTSPIDCSNIVLNIILNVFRNKVLIIREIKDKRIFVQLKSLLFG
jgi:hypothetical protein